MSEKVIRIVRIMNRIDDGTCPSVPKLAKELECCERTIHRDIAVIGSVIPVEYDREERRYRFSGRNSLKKLNLDKDELMLFCAMGDLSRQIGPSLEKPFQKIISRLVLPPGKLSLDSSPVAILRTCSSNAKDVSSLMETLSEAMRERSQVEFDYLAMHSGESTHRTVDPYGLLNTPDGSWLLLGHCHLRNKERTFALESIGKLRKTGKCFSRNGFDMKDFLGKSWSYYNGEEVTLTVRFPESVSRFIQKKEKWHPSEKRTVLESGDIECSFTVAGTIEIKRWIYSWLPNIEVLSPDWLRDEVRRELRQGATKHK